MTRTAIKTKWAKAPKSFEQAKALIARAPCCLCVVCGSALVLPIIRSPCTDWRIHCNNCGAEVGFHVVLNRQAWREGPQ